MILPMKICRFDENRVGLVLDDGVHDVTNVLSRLPAYNYPLPKHDVFISSLGELKPFLLEQAKKSPVVTPKRLLSPVANPGKIIAAPVNYTKHLQEALADKGIHHGNLIGEIHKVGMFLKATSAVVGPGEGVRLIHTDRRNDHEVELAVVIGRTIKNVSPDEARSAIAGYCIGLDMTIRGPEERSLRKSPDSYCVLGPWLVTADEIPNPNDLAISLLVNKEKRQAAHTSDLIIKVADLVAWGSTFYSLHPGDVLLTGTPQGVGPVKAGDVMDATIERIGSMHIAVTAA
jgi:2-keto-4-pentenoate hydratase/2-oxohepta-3-ene-1,7-dioic acid hydratase in catechol pathway